MDESKTSAGRSRARRADVGRAEEAAEVIPTVTRAAAASPAPSGTPQAQPKRRTDTRASAGADEELLDPRNPAMGEWLARRTPTGGYEIGEATLVLAIRAWDRRGDTARAQALCGVLIDRCMPEFKRRALGLRHRPDLMEEAIGGMIEQVLREARDPHETFMTQNFIHYLRCCCADNFGRVLRQEGLSYRRDEQGRPAGRPLHVPRALVERIDVSAEDREDEAGHGTVIADPRDATEERMAAVEAQRILGYLPDPMDRQIMVLRALEHMRWDDIAKVCGKTERTMRLRYEKAVVRLRQAIEAETATVAR